MSDSPFSSEHRLHRKSLFWIFDELEASDDQQSHHSDDGRSHPLGSELHGSILRLDQKASLAYPRPAVERSSERDQMHGILRVEGNGTDIRCQVGLEERCQMHRQDTVVQTSGSREPGTEVRDCIAPLCMIDYEGVILTASALISRHSLFQLLTTLFQSVPMLNCT